MLVKRIAAYSLPIYLQPFTSYIARYWSEIATFSYTPLYLTPPLGVFPWNSGKTFGSQKTRIMGYEAVKTV